MIKFIVKLLNRNKIREVKTQIKYLKENIKHLEKKQKIIDDKIKSIEIDKIMSIMNK